MNTQRFDWTDARVATLKELHQQGLSAGQIAGRMGATRNMIIGKLHRMPQNHSRTHRGRPAWTPEMIATAAKAWAENKPLSVIGAMIGKTHSQVSQYAQDHRDLFPKKDPSRKSTGSPMKRTAEPEYIAPQFLVPPEGYDAERLEHAKELHEIEARECRWPLNNGAPFMFCAVETEKGATYCVHHRMRARPKSGES